MSQPVRIPADVDREDRVIGPLTARQLLILTVTGIVLYGTYTVTRAFVPLAVFVVVAIPIGVTAAFLALGHRDGISLDRLVLAALRQRMSPQHRVAAPEGVRPTPEWIGQAASTTSSSASAVSPAALRLPAEGITDTGVIDLGKDGAAVVAVCSTINFGLRTPAEQEALVTSFGRYLHSLTAPVQVLVRTERLDLSGQIAELREQAGGLPHPALERAAREHAEYLDQLGRATDLLRRQVLLILREPLRNSGPTDGLGGASPLAALSARRRAVRQTASIDDAARRAAEARLVRRLGEALELLSPSGIVVTPLDASQATAVLTAACNPDSLIPPSSDLAGSDEVITTAPDESWNDTAFGRTAFATEDAFGAAEPGWEDDEDPDDYDDVARRDRR
ncbi:PrgI family protein [Amycolatopsis sp. SID8362]|uniref:PrgI family protein n=1 Tax=Amycolatopsis sp. SID8362 TaxID=2690346 RepID=UPI00136D5B80|nr:PrgI family protein [Amycolatopsis sp. SID8362]NBH04542.1 PrgI family protein [Amycolatopsis sp. SID8362]NED41241.1 PrgI family protein [Amycolatopsis sp. SID8362]